MSFGLQPLLHWFRKPATDAPLGRWVVVDTETSGLDPSRDRLLAIGGVAVDDDGILLGDSFEVIVMGGPSGDAANIVVHGIGHGAQAMGTPARDALTAFRAWAGDAPRVGFHTDFDGAVLRVADTGAGLAVDERPWLDLAQLAGALAPRARHSGDGSLDDWLRVFDIECSIRHNAASDALATAELLLRLRAIARAQGATSFHALVDAAREQRWLGNPG
jgi:DNA polymerase-3 subunit epsilon